MAFAIPVKVGGILEVTCRICKSKIDKSIAYCVFDGKRNKYYCSQSEYLNNIKDKENAEKQKVHLYKMIESFIGKTTNTALYKEINIWLSVSDYDTICSFLSDNKDKINYSLQKNFTSEYGKIRYFSAIIKNGIGDYKPTKPETPRRIEVEIYLVKYKPKARRKCLADYEDGE